MPSALVVAWHCEDDTETITGWLDVCKVRWRPGEIGISRDGLHKSPEFAPTYMSDAARENDMPSSLRTEPITGARFDALWEFLEKAWSHCRPPLFLDSNSRKLVANPVSIHTLPG